GGHPDRGCAPRPRHIPDPTELAEPPPRAPGHARRRHAPPHPDESHSPMSPVETAWRELTTTLRPRRGSPDGPLPSLLLTLTVVTGLVDATSYLKLGHVFVANMTGNVVFLGFGIAGAGAISICASLTALGSFSRRRPRRWPDRRPLVERPRSPPHRHHEYGASARH